MDYFYYHFSDEAIMDCTHSERYIHSLYGINLSLKSLHLVNVVSFSNMV
jgi:hypothetical protein